MEVDACQIGRFVRYHRLIALALLPLVADLHRLTALFCYVSGMKEVFESNVELLIQICSNGARQYAFRGLSTLSRRHDRDFGRFSGQCESRGLVR